VSLVPGARIGSFEVVSRLGAGGMGEVYRATDAKPGRDVALKILPDAFAHDADPSLHPPFTVAVNWQADLSK
jgi:serine/threonine protein kinase